MVADASSTATPCLAGGEELTLPLRVRANESIDFKAWICNTAARLHLLITDSQGHQQTVLDQQAGLHVGCTLPPLIPGRYVLLWTFTVATQPWQTRVEIHVRGAELFRHRKSDNSRFAVTRGFANLEIVP